MMQYHFILQDNTQKAYRLFTWFLFFFHIVAAGVIGMNGTANQTRIELIIFFVMLSLLGILYYLFRKQKAWMDALGIAMALLCFVFWEKNVGMVAAIIIALIFLLIMAVKKRKAIVFISADGVVLKRVLSKTRYPWQELDNVVLKDGLLTIDLLSNKILQAELAKENEAVNEEQFNLFCRLHLQNKN
jgi:hypothetical protein